MFTLHYRKTFFVHLRIYPSPCHPFPCFANHALHFVPHVLISSKWLRGSSLVLSLGYSKDFFVIFQILFSMLKINVYSIIDSNVFSVTVGDNFLFAIGVKSFYDCKHAVEEQRMQMGSIHANNAN